MTLQNEPPEENERSLEWVVERLRARGHRLTPQRLAILQTVMGSRQHPTAEEIYRQVAADYPMLSPATVYKTLHMLQRIGELREIRVDGCGHYDSDIAPHPHLICTECGGIVDLPTQALQGMSEEALIQAGFHPPWQVQIYGRCSDCHGAEQSRAKKGGVR